MKDSDEINNQLDYTLSIGNVQLNSSERVYDRIVRMSIDHHKDETKTGSTYAELPIDNCLF